MTVYRQQCVVKSVEQRFKTEWVSGMGKDAVTKEVSDGWWIMFFDNPAALRCENEPECKKGDTATCTWEFSKP